jgi:hypothetical protein
LGDGCVSHNCAGRYYRSSSWRYRCLLFWWGKRETKARIRKAERGADTPRREAERQIRDLRLYYAEKTPYLEPETIELIESFYKTLQSLHLRLMDSMGDLYWYYAQGHGRTSWWSDITLDEESSAQYHRAGQASLAARFDPIAWDYSPELEGLSAESKRLLGE